MKRITYSKLKSADFYKLFKFLFYGKYKELSAGAKILYSLLYDRLSLSLENDWRNEKDEVYLIFTVNQMCELLNCSNKTAGKYKKELLEFNLLEEEKQFGEKPNLLFLKDDDSLFGVDQYQIDYSKSYLEDKKLNKLFISYLEVRETAHIKTTENDINILITRLHEHGKNSQHIKEKIIIKAIDKQHKSFFPLSNNY